MHICSQGCPVIQGATSLAGRSRMADVQVDTRGCLPASERQGSTLRHRLERVLHQVEEDTAKRIGVERHRSERGRSLPLQPDPTLGHLRSHFLEEPVYKYSHIRWL